MKKSESKVKKICNCGSEINISQLSSESSSKLVKMVAMFEHINASGHPNFRRCRIPLPSKLNVSLWRERLSKYEDKVVCEFLEYGFPIDFDRKKKLSHELGKNHKGARDYPEFVRKFIQKECQEGRIIGPFKNNPLSVPLQVSPINTVPKSSEDERRMIVDLSWPKGLSVNDGISKDFYMGEVIDLHYASVEEVCRMVLEIGPGAVIYKRDLRHAYRQISVDPRDFCYLGYFWEDEYFFDTTLAMGQRNAAMACSRVTKGVMYIHGEEGHKGTSYLDDLIGVSHPDYGTVAYESLGQLLEDLGLMENMGKACPPSTIQLVLGVEIDTVKGTISVPDERLREIIELLGEWQGKAYTKKVKLQSLIGKLQFVTKYVRQSRVFLNRMLETLRAMKEKESIKLTQSFQKDVRWWLLFIEKFNGVSYIPPIIWTEPDVVLSTDSSLKGCGGICHYQYFHSSYPVWILDQSLPIHKLEMLSVLIAIRFWGSHCTGSKVQIFCDNEPVVRVINSSKTKDEFLSTCLRELWLVVSTYGFELRCVHLPGVDNRVADWLSRWDMHPQYPELFRKFMGEEAEQYVEMKVTNEMFAFSNEL